ncbi:membrane protein [Brachybacterium conglomeratum]|uniref:Membrane protein n=1 Tax=Brachybacterium conglomeratum TaxID=47846 RepID=A0ABQ5RH03_9MICO|nr:membrane protein [Brachybacterium conglomeratum]GLK05211.1 membrane protein [Brachybacterium conglomeratum]
MCSGLVLLVVIALVLLLVSLVRGAGTPPEQQQASTAAESAAPEHDGTPADSDEGGTTSAEDDAPAAEPTGEGTPGEEATPTDDAAERTPEAESPEAGGDVEMVRSGTVGAGTWTVAAAGDAPTEGVLRPYAVRVEDGIDVDAEEAAEEIAAVLADERGWQGPADVVFHRVADPAEAEFTISIGSPPTVDELCLPAKTGGVWSCRIGPEVALNSDRWLHATPTYDDLAEYRAYMINHEVGHFLGHGHASCPAEGAPAPVMLQQSIDLQGCTPNAWPAGEEG